MQMPSRCTTAASSGDFTSCGGRTEQLVLSPRVLECRQCRAAAAAAQHLPSMQMAGARADRALAPRPCAPAPRLVAHLPAMRRYRTPGVHHPASHPRKLAPATDESVATIGQRRRTRCATRGLLNHDIKCAIGPWLSLASQRRRPSQQRTCLHRVCNFSPTRDDMSRKSTQPRAGGILGAAGWTLDSRHWLARGLVSNLLHGAAA